MGVDGQGSRKTGGSTPDRIFFMKYPLPFLQQKISNSRLVQVYMSKQSGMDVFPLYFFVFKQTASHLTAEVNVEHVFSRAGQLSEVNLDPDALVDMKRYR
jgi:hypothetical protein